MRMKSSTTGLIFPPATVPGVANGKVQDSPRRRDPCLKSETETLPILDNPSPRLCAGKTEPETLLRKNPCRRRS